MTAVEEQPATRTAIAGPPRIADRLYHDLPAPEEIMRLRSRVRGIASRVVAPLAHRIANGDEREDGFPRDVFDGLAAEGLYRVEQPVAVAAVGQRERVTLGLAPGQVQIIDPAPVQLRPRLVDHGDQPVRSGGGERLQRRMLAERGVEMSTEGSNPSPATPRRSGP